MKDCVKVEQNEQYTLYHPSICRLLSSRSSWSSELSDYLNGFFGPNVSGDYQRGNAHRDRNGITSATFSLTILSKKNIYRLVADSNIILTWNSLCFVSF